MTDNSLHFECSKEYNGILFASTLARQGRRVYMMCTKEQAPELRRRILDENHGSWPIGMQLKTL